MYYCNTSMSSKVNPLGVISKFSQRDYQHRRLFSGHDAVSYLRTTFINAIWLEKRPDKSVETKHFHR